MAETKQVEKSHYEFQKYVGKPRWISMWHQLDELMRLSPEQVLEIGPGPGLFKAVAGQFGLHVETMDLAADLNPDHVGSVTDMPFEDNSFDVVCAFQVLEHLPYEMALEGYREMRRVSRGNVLISLPDAKLVWRYAGYIPKIGKIDWLMPRPFAKPKQHEFDGQHHWEINKRDYPLERIMADFSDQDSVIHTYRIKENSFHRFFVITPK
ncbi:class I SAM-dependent methyltransferase [Pseudogemmobacter sp. W21_MBD1_M6]|uniref:class I SAM-dependent methyltransferase n=1 Tax=Pseudogemmobacter sp. W21_MBD1_M6 TaxID=3240271 RepID=UPI003F944404